MSVGFLYRVNSWFNKRFERWLVKRVPAASQQTLSNKNIFIFPSKFGVVYLFFVLVLFLLATNYQNNVIMLISYLLASIFISAMLQSFFNLSGLSFIATEKVYGFAEDDIYLPIKIITNKSKFSLVFSFKEQVHTALIAVVKPNSEQQYVHVPFYASKRGVFKLPRIKVSSEYALGLFNCWTHLDFNCQLVVYPKPQAVSVIQPVSDGELSEQTPLSYQQGGDDFYQLKAYQQGEPLSRIAWKQVAKGQGWYSKAYQQPQGQQLALRLSDMPSSSIENKLSYLCYLVHEYYQKGYSYSLDLGGTHIALNEGEQHFKACLFALAQYPANSLEGEQGA